MLPSMTSEAMLHLMENLCLYYVSISMHFHKDLFIWQNLKRCKGRITERNYEKTELWSYRKIELWKDVITENGIKKRQKYRIKE